MGKKLSFAMVILLLSIASAQAESDLLSEQAKAYYIQGVEAENGGNFFGADAFFQKTLYLEPNNKTWQKYIFNNRGVMYAKQGDMDRAEAAFNDALRIDADYKPAQINLGFIHEKRRTRLESLEYWAKVFEFDKIKPKDYVVEDAPLKEVSKGKK
jgi:tetratricopeptide (TPR) repeat protein